MVKEMSLYKWKRRPTADSIAVFHYLDITEKAESDSSWLCTVKEQEVAAVKLQHDKFQLEMRKRFHNGVVKHRNC